MTRRTIVAVVTLAIAALIAVGCAAGPAGGAQQAPAAPAPAEKPAQPAAAKPAAPAAPQQPAPAAAGQIKWRAAFFGPPREASAGDEWLKKELEARTNGRMTIENAYGEVLAKATEIPDGLKAGAYEIGWFCASYYPGKLPLYSVLDSAFLAPENLETLSRLQLALFEHPAIQEELKKWNAKGLRPNPLESYQIMGKKRIATVDDLKGVRIRVSGEMARPLEEFGAVKSLVPAPEVYTSLDKGIVDAVTFPGTYAFVTYKINEIAKYFTDKISLGTQPCFRAVNLDAWAKLPPDIQKTLGDLAAQSYKADIEAYSKANEKNYPLFRDKGIEIINFPPAERAKLVAVAEKHWKGWIEDKQKKGLRGQEVFDFVQAKIKELSRS